MASPTSWMINRFPKSSNMICCKKYKQEKQKQQQVLISINYYNTIKWNKSQFAHSLKEVIKMYWFESVFPNDKRNDKS